MEQNHKVFHALRIEVGKMYKQLSSNGKIEDIHQSTVGELWKQVFDNVDTLPNSIDNTMQTHKIVQMSDYMKYHTPENYDWNAMSNVFPKEEKKQVVEAQRYTEQLPQIQKMIKQDNESSASSPTTHKQSVSYNFYRTGEYNSYTGLYLSDIFTSDNFRALSKRPKAQLVLLNMIDCCNRLYVKNQNGFIFTYSQCCVDICEKEFRESLDHIIEKGWFTRELLQNKYLYFPSQDWKNVRLADIEIEAIQSRDTTKESKIERDTKRIDEYRATDNQIRFEDCF